MEENKIYKLDELSNGRGSYGIAASAVPFSNHKYTYLRITDINDDGTLKKDSLMSVDDKKASGYLLNKNDIVFARTGNSTGRSYFYDGSDGELVFAGFLIKFSIDENKVNPRILKYYTHSTLYYNWIRSFDTGGTRGNINAKTYGDMPIRLPSRKTQDKIVDILKSFDDKIELNNRINANLEKQAQALFRRWFVENKKEEWTYVDLGSVVKTISGGTPSRSNLSYYKNGTIKWLKSKELTGTYILQTEERITQSAIENSSAKLLPQNSVLIAMYGATVGAYAIIADTMACNQAICALLPNEYYPCFYLFMLIKNKKEEFINSAVGSAQQNISQVLIKQVQVPTCRELIRKYDKLVVPYFEQIMNNIKQNQFLCQLREILLSKLMNREIEI